MKVYRNGVSTVTEPETWRGRRCRSAHIPAYMGVARDGSPAVASRWIWRALGYGLVLAAAGGLFWGQIAYRAHAQGASQAPQGPAQGVDRSRGQPATQPQEPPPSVIYLGPPPAQYQLPTETRCWRQGYSTVCRTR